MHAIIVAIIFLSAFLLAISVFFMHEDRRNQAKDHILGRLASSADQLPAKGILEKRMGDSLERAIGQFIDLRPLIRLLEQAHVNISTGRFLVLCSALVLLSMVPAIILFNGVVAVLIGLGAGGLTPLIFLTHRRRKCENALVEQLPDAVDMLIRALRAGQGLDASLNEVARAFPPPIGAELGRVYEEMAMGLSFEQAIRGFESRFSRVSDVKMLCAALLIQRETGGNLTAILDSMVHTIRQRLTFFRQVRALGAEGRISAYILGALPVAFGFITWLQRPEYILMLFTQPTGKKVLLAAILLEGLGFGLLFHLSRIKV